ncbi:MAG: hypothetical protein B1H04_00015 [Planctomycetales bacterium 4484_123]|nr:MAG: hypothetical protein B1H04_00015 [Planctomycetales bacterium 4484_123]
MNILIVQLVPPSHAPDRPRFCHELGLAVAMLRRRNLEVALVAMSDYDRDRLRSAVTRHRPSHILMDVPPHRHTLARHTIVEIAERHYLPVILVGRYATSQPEQAISIPGVTALIRGEYDQALPRLTAALATSDLSPAEVPGVWFNSEEGLVRNVPDKPTADLDTLPHPDRDIFDYGRTVSAEHEAAFRATRGCLNWCAHCLNDWYIELYGRDGYLRRRSVDHLLAEISAVVERYQGIQGIVFEDHAFATDAEWLARFAEEYPRRCGLPFRCRVCLNAVGQHTAELLARAGCRQVDVQIGSGSNFIREEVLTLRTSHNQILNGVSSMKRAGLAVRGMVFIGVPYESEVSVEETLDLVTALKLDEVVPRIFFPIAGTRAAEVCAENGWISGRGEECFYVPRSVLEMPSLPAERIDEIFHRFHALLRSRSGHSLAAWWRRIRKLATQPLHTFGRSRRRQRPRGHQ